MGHRAAADILRIAHRGGASGAEDYRPENLHRIAGLGIHLVEVDLQSTKDGHVVAYHDLTVRADGVQRQISDLTLAEWRGVLPAGRMPAIEMVVAAARDAALGLYLDIKDVTRAGAIRLVDLLAVEHMRARTILASSNQATIAMLAGISHSIPRAVLFTGLDQDPVRLARLARANFVHPCWENAQRPDQMLSRGWLDSVRLQGLGVVCWHEERPDVLAALRDLGVDGVCTDAPERLADVLGR
ncbi:MAG: glycerophosphodiester phosphodiesterase [Pseudonocardiaceae bacterium]